jgi:hypothetical protein
MAFAVIVDETPYFLTHNGQLCMSDCTWGREAPAPGALVAVTGVAEERRDANDRRYQSIEFVSLVSTENDADL